jgi:hypothetical protein
LFGNQLAHHIIAGHRNGKLVESSGELAIGRRELKNGPELIGFAL